jgi:O-antigen/teichoic acid export membrane protein
MLLYLSPIAISNICFVWLVSFDMVLVKYYFSGRESGAYSLAQLVGKIFLFLPGAISIVMFPRTSFLNSTNSNTSAVLNKSLLYAFCLCLSAALFYNIFPSFVLRILTGKALGESIVLGRLFSVSMTFFALCFILINYFLSLKSCKFIKYLVLSVVVQFIGIVLFHNNLIQVQLVLCFNSFLLFVLLILQLRFETILLPGTNRQDKD